MKKAILILIILFFLQFLFRIMLDSLSAHQSMYLTYYDKLSDKEITGRCTNKFYVNNEYFSIEQCPNGDFYLDRKGPAIDGQISVYDKNKNLIKRWGGMSRTFTITPIYLWRVLTFQQIGCEEKEARNYCYKNIFPTVPTNTKTFQDNNP